MKVIIFGATGMIGNGVLLECLDAPDVESVLTIGRRTLELEHPELTQAVHTDFDDFSSIEAQVAAADACFYCLGVASSGMSEARYREITLVLTRSVVTAFARLAPDMTFCFISGAGTALDGRAMWARVKAEAEEVVKAAGFAHAYCFRPGYIQPMRGVSSQVASYRAMYAVTSPLYGLLKRLPKYVSSTVQVGQAMLNAARLHPELVTLESADIVALAAREA